MKRGWHWIGYRYYARSSLYATSYQVLGRRRWRGRPDAERLVGAGAMPT